MKIAMIGAGSVGGALALRWAAAGHQILLGVRDPHSERVRTVLAQSSSTVSLATCTIREAVDASEIVVLATPWAGAEDAIRAAGDLTGKIVIDCTNPLAADLSLTIGHTVSGGELIAAAAVGARVVKAFNTTGSGNMQNPWYDRVRPAMFVCGDDSEARSTVITLAEEIGFEGIDSGPLANARLLEPVAAFWIWLAYAGGLGRDVAFGLLRR